MNEKQELLELIVRHSFERRKVTLSSGKESDFYLDLRTTMMRPRGIALAGALLLEAKSLEYGEGTSELHTKMIAEFALGIRKQ